MQLTIYVVVFMRCHDNIKIGADLFLLVLFVCSISNIITLVPLL